MDILSFQNSISSSIHDKSMLIQNIIIFKNVFPNIEIPSFNLFLNTRDSIGYERRLHDWFIIWRTRSERGVQNRSNPITSENTHNIIGRCNHELGEARISLTPGSPPELIVDSPGLMFLGSHYEESTERIGESLVFYGSFQIDRF